MLPPSLFVRIPGCGFLWAPSILLLLLMRPLAPVQGSPLVAPAVSEAASIEGAVRSTPALIEQAFQQGEISAEQRILYLAYALHDYTSLPARFRSNQPWDGTLIASEVQEAVRRLRASQPRGAKGDLLAELDRLVPSAEDSVYCLERPAAHTSRSPHFILQYDEIQGGLQVDDYVATLEAVHDLLIEQYGWARPPMSPFNSEQRYPVQIVPLGGGLYGYVTVPPGGWIGDNPSTGELVEQSAQASCMVLNSNMAQFSGPSEALHELQATVAHEYVHAIQLAYGDPGEREDPMWYESTATYMEKEVVSGSSTLYQYLWPRFTACQGAYPSEANSISHYSNWLFFRYVAWHYGGIGPEGGEEIMQHFFEQVARGEGALHAYDRALQEEGASFSEAFHHYAVATRFMRDEAAAPAPYFYNEADQYLAYPYKLGSIHDHGAVTAELPSYRGEILDHYSLNWISLPSLGSYDVRLESAARGGILRVSIIADLGTSLVVTPFEAFSLFDGTAHLPGYRPPPGARRVVAVITNERVLSANPATCKAVPYRLHVAMQKPFPSLTYYLPLMRH